MPLRFSELFIFSCTIFNQKLTLSFDLDIIWLFLFPSYHEEPNNVVKMLRKRGRGGGEKGSLAAFTWLGGCFTS